MLKSLYLSSLLWGSHHQPSPCSRMETGSSSHSLQSPCTAIESWDLNPEPGDSTTTLCLAGSLSDSQGAAQCVGSCVASFPSHSLKWELCQSVPICSQDPSRIGCALRICQLPPRRQTPWNFPVEIPFCSAGRVGPSPLHETPFCSAGCVGPSPPYRIAGRCAGQPAFSCAR